jgi:ABC-type glycerol-3-phosphate transport system permease component
VQGSGLSGRPWSIPKTLFAALLVVPFAYPLLFLVATALRSSAAYNHSPLGFSGLATFSHLTYAWTAGSLGSGAINSLIAVSIGVASCCVVSSCAAYWFFRHTGLVAKGLFGLLFIGWVVPFAVYLLPLYLDLSRRGLINNVLVLGVTYGAIFTPFGTFFLTAYLRQALPREILEAASVDGASLVRQFLRIVVPLSRPAITTLAALTFVWMWGDLIVAVTLVSNDPAKLTIVLALNTLVDATLSAGGSANTVQSVAAATLISLLPMLTVIYLAQRAIVQGFGTGGVKG